MSMNADAFRGKEKVSLEVSELKEKNKQQDRAHREDIVKKDQAHALELAKAHEVIQQKQHQLAGLQKMESNLKAKQAELESRTSQIARDQSKLEEQRNKVQSTIDKGLKDAMVNANKDVEVIRKAAKHELEVAQQQVVRSQNQWRDQEITMQEMQTEINKRSEELFSNIVQTAEQVYLKEYHRALEDALAREKRHRSDYDSYHQLWDKLRKSIKGLETRNTSAKLRLMSTLWKSTHDGTTTKILVLLRKGYPAIAKSYEEYLSSKQSAALQASRSLDEILERVQQSSNVMFRSSHVHRKLALYHRFLDAPSDYDTMLSHEQYQNRHLESLLAEKKMEMKMLAERLEITTSSSEKESMRTEMARLEDERLSATNWMVYLVHKNRSVALKALKSDSPVEKALFFDLEPLRAIQISIDTAINGLARLQRESATIRRLNADNIAAFVLRNNSLKVEFRNVESSLRKKLLLEADLGQTSIDEASLDRLIDAKIGIESERAATQLRAAVGWRGTLAKSAARTRRDRMAEERELVKSAARARREKREEERERNVTISTSRTIRGEKKEIEFRLAELRVKRKAVSPDTKEGIELRYQHIQALLAYQKLHLDTLEWKRPRVQPIRAAQIEFEIRGIGMRVDSLSKERAALEELKEGDLADATPGDQIRAASDAPSPASTSPLAQGMLRPLEARLAELKPLIAAEPHDSETKKELQQEQAQVKLTFQTDRLEVLKQKRSRTVSPEQLRRLNREASRLTMAIAKSSGEAVTAKPKSRDRDAKDVETTSQQPSEQPAHVTETTLDNIKTPFTTPRSAKTHRERRLIRMVTRDFSNSKPSAEGNRENDESQEERPLVRLYHGGGNQHNIFNLQPTPRRQAIHVFMAQTAHNDSWSATPTQGVLDLATLAEGLTPGEPDNVVSHASSERERVPSHDTSTRASDFNPDFTSDPPMPSSSQATLSEADTSSAYQPSEEDESHSATVPDMSPLSIADESPAASLIGSNNDGLTYRVSPEDYRKAVIASQNTSAAFWSYKLYKNRKGQTPTIRYCTTFEQAETQAKHFLEEPIVGFDLEWEVGSSPGKSSIQNSVSLIQIASEDKIGLFHLSLFKGETPEQLLPPSLRTLLESKNIAKAGVNVAGDARRLQQCLDVNIAGYFELSHLYRIVMYSETNLPEVNRKLVKLATQVQDVLLLPMYKGQVRTSAWSRRLKLDQLDYAASDAYSGFQLYQALNAKRKNMTPMPPVPAMWEDDMPLVLGNGQKVFASAYSGKRKARMPVEKAVEEAEDDDDDEEYFDAVEEFDDPQIGSSHSAGLPLSGISVVYPTLPPAESVDDAEPAIVSTGSRSRPTGSARPPNSRQPPPSAEISHAEQWATTWKASLPPEYNLRASHSKLRAYHLWHQQSLSCSQVATLLRNPPLSIITVANYVLDVVRDENLPYQTDRAKAVLVLLPDSVHGRYHKILRQISE